MGRKPKPQGPREMATVLLERSEMKQVDRARGEVPRSTWIRGAVLQRLHLEGKR